MVYNYMRTNYGCSILTRKELAAIPDGSYFVCKWQTYAGIMYRKCLKLTNYLGIIPVSLLCETKETAEKQAV